MNRKMLFLKGKILSLKGKNSSLKGKILSFVCIIFIAVLLVPVKDVEAKPVLQANSKVMRVGQIYTLKLKNVYKKKYVKWRSNKKSVVSIKRKNKNVVVLKARKKGMAIITATYKGKSYKCRIKVKSNEHKSNEHKFDDKVSHKSYYKEKPTLNATHVDLYYISDFYKNLITYDKYHLREFQFRVNGTDQDVISWDLVGEDKDFFKISSNGKVTLFWGVTYEEFVKKVKVKATLRDGTVLTADVFEYNEVNLYLNKLFAEFEKTYITDDMTELEKVEKVAWYIGAKSDYKLYSDDWIFIFLKGEGDCAASKSAVCVLCRYLGIKALPCSSIDYHGQTLVKADGKFYMVVTGFNEPKPRSYFIYEVSDDELKTIARDNNIWLGYFKK